MTFEKAFKSYFSKYHRKFPFEYDNFEFIDYDNNNKLVNDYQFRLKYLWKDNFSLKFPFPKIIVKPKFGNIFYKFGTQNPTAYI